MPPLANGLRNDLETVVKKARVIAEHGAKSALEALTVHEARSGNHLDAAGQNLRKRLRAHAKQLGDARKPNGEQAIGRLIRECAYEHWHRMLFARFLAENDLLIHPEHNVSVSLDDVLELAREQGIDQWELASRFATRMLPQIFRPDDPVLAVALPRERTLELEQLLESLPVDTFKADDSLGWVYQFWQAEEKKRVNDTGEKITGETLPAVTQLFTEHYMVLFLLHNTIGAWWVGKKIANGEARIANAATEADVRVAAALPNYPFEYLRFVRGWCDGHADGNPTGPWRPAAGTFDGWPLAAKDLKVLDPCCGSGHFLVAAFELLVRVRMAEERMALEDAIRGVLSDNLFGLELDARCTQIAAFNLALAAWRMVGRPIDLPTLNIACCGLGPHASENDWLQLAEQSGVAIPAIDREPIRNGLRNLHALFSQAPELGALIDPTELPGNLIAADWETLQPYLTGILKAESHDEEAHERAVAAAGMARATEILAGEYTLVVTNVPYLGRGKQSATLRDWGANRGNDAKADLATMLVSRSLDWCAFGSSVAVVSPHNWLFIAAYSKMRQRLLSACSWNLVARLGPKGFQTPMWDFNVSLVVITTGVDECNIIADVDVAGLPNPSDKAKGLAGASSIVTTSQHDQLSNPDHAVLQKIVDSKGLLSAFAETWQGLVTTDDNKFLFGWWEIEAHNGRWAHLQIPAESTRAFCGRSHVIRWDDARGDLHRASNAHNFPSAKMLGRPGVAVRRMPPHKATLFGGDVFDDHVAPIVPTDPSLLAPLWCFCTSTDYLNAVKLVDQQLKVAVASFLKVPFDIPHWQKVAAETYPGGLPEPESDEPTQWLFHGRPEASTAPLQVAVGRLLGYRWPAELDDKMHLSARARELVRRCAELAPFADGDGIVCIPPVRGERPAADRLAALLAACGVRPDRDLDAWLREEFFAEHCKLFHDRPFTWHIWDGRNDGFHTLISYHRLAAPDGAGRKLLESLTHSYLGDWIRNQKDQVAEGKPGAEARLTAALDLKAELEKILAGEPPYDIFVRWKALREQPIGWEPDINDGVRLNIRPFLMAQDVGRKGAGVLRCKPNIKWDKDRGKEPQSLRPKADFPWFWGCDAEKHPAHRTNFAGGDTFDGNRWNDLHYTTALKQAARGV
jgi:hypothetical protein